MLVCCRRPVTAPNDRLDFGPMGQGGMYHVFKFQTELDRAALKLNIPTSVTPKRFRSTCHFLCSPTQRRPLCPTETLSALAAMMIGGCKRVVERAECALQVLDGH
eukprot:543241-Rhodomonas_salina.3